jgi:hypothetical protein
MLKEGCRLSSSFSLSCRRLSPPERPFRRLKNTSNRPRAAVPTTDNRVKGLLTPRALVNKSVSKTPSSVVRANQTCRLVLCLLQLLLFDLRLSSGLRRHVEQQAIVSLRRQEAAELQVSKGLQPLAGEQPQTVRQRIERNTFDGWSSGE